jgi:hypothetical protein
MFTLFDAVVAGAAEVATAWATMEAISAAWAWDADALALAFAAAVFEIELPVTSVATTTAATTKTATADAPAMIAARFFFGAAGGVGSYCGKPDHCWSEGAWTAGAGASAESAGPGWAFGDSDGS